MEYKEGVISAFDSLAEEYDCWFDEPGGSVIFSSEVEAVKLLMPELRRPFIEIGTGSGRFAQALGIEYGVEPSERLGLIARRRGIKVVFEKGEKLPIQDTSFGGVFILSTLCFVEDPVVVIKEALRVLSDDGGLVVGFINRESPWGELYLKKKTEGHPIYSHAEFFTPEEVSEIFKQAGLKKTAVVSSLLAPPSDNQKQENPKAGLVRNAGFICMLAHKT